jgi:hypothetical protein
MKFLYHLAHKIEEFLMNYQEKIRCRIPPLNYHLNHLFQYALNLRPWHCWQEIEILNIPPNASPFRPEILCDVITITGHMISSQFISSQIRFLERDNPQFWRFS